MDYCETKMSELRICISKGLGASKERPWLWEERQGYVLMGGPFVGGTGPGSSESFLSTSDARIRLLEWTVNFPWGSVNFRFNDWVISTPEHLLARFDAITEEYERELGQRQADC